MADKTETPSLSEKIGFSIGTIIGFLIIFVIGLFALWVTMEPYH
jgi:tetrahydromethanopterin S-methyltransferase subunit G